MWKRIFGCWLLLCSYSNVQAADNEVSATSGGNGYLAIGIGLVHLRNPYIKNQLLDDTVHTMPLYSFAYEFSNGIFIEESWNSGYLYNNPVLGYQLAQRSDFDLELIVSVTRYLFEFDYLDDQQQKQSFDKGFTPYLGLRTRGQWRGLDLSLTMAPLVTRNGGVYASAKLGKRWRLQHWYLTAALNAEYRSSQITNYYVGVDHQEPEHNALLRTLPEYQAPAAVDLSYNLSATYPLSATWIFDVFTRYTRHDKAFRHSPLVQDMLTRDNGASDNTLIAGVVLSYVW